MVILIQKVKTQILYIKDLEKFAPPVGPLYGKPIMDKEYLDSWAYINKDMGVDKFGNIIDRPISKREEITENLNAPIGSRS